MPLTDRTAPRHAVPGSDTFEVLDRDRCLALLSATTVGRLAFSGDDGIVLLPVNYRVVSGAVVVRTSTTGTLAQLASTPRDVAFGADYHSPTTRSGWSVLVRGTASVVTDERVLASPEVARVVSWVSGDHALVLAVPLDRVTGRSVG